MHTIIELTKGEWTKIMARGKSKVLLIIIALFALGAGILFFFVEKRLNITLMEGELFPIWVLNRLMSFILPLLTLMTVADVVAGEFQEGTIKNVFALPAKRTALYGSKLLALSLYVLLMLGVAAGISFLGALIVSGFSAFLGIGNIIIAYLGAFVVLGLIIVMAALIALFISSSSFALVVSLMLWLGMGTVGIFLPGIAPFLPTSYLHWYEPFITNGSLQLAIPMLLYMISYYIILTIFGTIKFQQKEG